MKIKTLLIYSYFLTGTLFINAQNVASNSSRTSGGLEAGNNGSNNTFYGYRSGKNNTGSFNTFIGQLTGEENSDKSNNTYVGSMAGANNTGSNNAYFGSRAGYENWGSNNTYIGASSGFDTYGGSNNIFIGYQSGSDSQEAINNKLFIENSSSKTPLIWGDFSEDKLKFNGKVGIGYGFGNIPTTVGGANISNYNLFVDGGILTEEIRVMLKNQWADYVFNDDYNLLKLEEIEKFIKENKHLPNVPSAQEIKNNGIELGEIAIIQQEKIEELTLYTIQQQKEIDELKSQVQLLLKNKE